MPGEGTQRMLKRMRGRLRKVARENGENALVTALLGEIQVLDESVEKGAVATGVEASLRLVTGVAALRYGVVYAGDGARFAQELVWRDQHLAVGVTLLEHLLKECREERREPDRLGLLLAAFLVGNLTDTLPDASSSRS